MPTSITLDNILRVFVGVLLRIEAIPCLDLVPTGEGTARLHADREAVQLAALDKAGLPMRSRASS